MENLPPPPHATIDDRRYIYDDEARSKKRSFSRVSLLDGQASQAAPNAMALSVAEGATEEQVLPHSHQALSPRSGRREEEQSERKLCES